MKQVRRCCDTLQWVWSIKSMLYSVWMGWHVLCSNALHTTLFATSLHCHV